MKKLNSIHFHLLAFVLIFNIPNSFSQHKIDSCKVPLKEISASYVGDCKNGLADGKGIASGEESYSGMFKKGLPEGKGTYTYKDGSVYSGNWENGIKNGKGELKSQVNGNFTTIKGFWKDGDYIGKSKPIDNDFRISNLSGIENYSVKRTESTENLIEISFEKVMKKYIPKDITISISSGYKIEQNLKILIQNYNIPVNCSLHFTIPMGGSEKQCNFGFDVLKAGKYTVFISNN